MCIAYIVIVLRLKKNKYGDKNTNTCIQEDGQNFFRPYTPPPRLLVTRTILLLHTGLYARLSRLQVSQDYDRSLCDISSRQSAAPVNTFHTLLSLFNEVLYVHYFQHFSPVINSRIAQTPSIYCRVRVNLLAPEFYI
jgi:hypothetical protein